MRLDSDSFIHSAESFLIVACFVFDASITGEVRVDPFQEFSSRQCSYGYIGIGSEHPRMFRELFETIDKFMQKTPKQVQSWFRHVFLDKGGAYNGNFFYNNFEM